MNLLQIFFIISGIIIFILALNIGKKQKFNALHFVVFILVGVGLFIFSLSPEVLKGLGNIFGLEKGADALIYGGIVFLIYFVLLLLIKVEKNRENITKLVREISILENKLKNDEDKKK